MVNRKTATGTVQVLFQGTEAEKELPPEQQRRDVTVKFSDVRNMPRPEDLRRTPNEMQELVLGIATIGLRERIEVIALPDGGWWIHEGKHRAESLRRLERTEFPATILQSMTPAEQAVDRAVKNGQRVNSTPWQDCIDYHEALFDEKGKPRLTQKQLAVAVGVSEATVASRLALRALGEAIGRRAGIDITLEGVQELLPLAEHPSLLERVAKALPDPKKLAKQPRPYLSDHEVRSLATEALTDGKDAPAINVHDQSLGEHWDLHDKAYEKQVSQIPSIKLGHMVLSLDPPKVRELAKQARERRIQREAAQPKTRSTGRNAEQLRQERLNRHTRKLQLDLMVKHVQSRTGWGEEFVKALYRQVLRRGGLVAAGKAEVEALRAVTGLPDLDGRSNEALVDKLWDKDRATLDRYVAAVLFLLNKNFQGKIVTDDAVAKLTTGMTPKEAMAAARRAMDAGKGQKATPKEAQKDPGSTPHPTEAPPAAGEVPAAPAAA